MECAAIGNLIEDMKMARDVEHTTVHMPKVCTPLLAQSHRIYMYCDHQV